MVSMKRTRNYDAELQEVLGIYEKHKVLSIAMEKGEMWAEPRQVTCSQWISSEGSQVENNADPRAHSKRN